MPQGWIGLRDCGSNGAGKCGLSLCLLTASIRAVTPGKRPVSVAGRRRRTACRSATAGEYQAQRSGEPAGRWAARMRVSALRGWDRSRSLSGTGAVSPPKPRSGRGNYPPHWRGRVERSVTGHKFPTRGRDPPPPLCSLRNRGHRAPCACYKISMSALPPIESGFATAEEAEAYDRWFRAKVRASLEDPRPCLPHDAVMTEIEAIVSEVEQQQRR